MLSHERLSSPVDTNKPFELVDTRPTKEHEVVNVDAKKNKSTKKKSTPREPRVILDKKQSELVTVDASKVIHMPKGGPNGEPGSARHPILCERFHPDRPESCTKGDKCNRVHASLRGATRKTIHINWAWRKLEDCQYECFPAGQKIQVREPVSAKSDIVDTVDSGHIIKTRCVFDDAKRPPTRCAHFYYGRECHLASRCDYAHVVYIKENAQALERAPPPLVFGRRRNEEAQDQPSASAVTNEEGEGDTVGNVDETRIAQPTLTQTSSKPKSKPKKNEQTGSSTHSFNFSLTFTHQIPSQSQQQQLLSYNSNGSHRSNKGGIPTSTPQPLVMSNGSTCLPSWSYTNSPQPSSSFAATGGHGPCFPHVPTVPQQHYAGPTADFAAGAGPGGRKSASSSASYSHHAINASTSAHYMPSPATGPVQSRMSYCGGSSSNSSSSQQFATSTLLPQFPPAARNPPSVSPSHEKSLDLERFPCDSVRHLCGGAAGHHVPNATVVQHGESEPPATFQQSTRPNSSCNRYDADTQSPPLSSVPFAAVATPTPGADDARGAASVESRTTEVGGCCFCTCNTRGAGCTSQQQRSTMGSSYSSSPQQQPRPTTPQQEPPRSTPTRSTGSPSSNQRQHQHQQRQEMQLKLKSQGRWRYNPYDSAAAVMTGV